VTAVTLKATGLPLQSARYTVENPPELSGERFLIWSRGTSRAGAAFGRRGLIFASAEPGGSGFVGMRVVGLAFVREESQREVRRKRKGGENWRGYHMTLQQGDAVNPLILSSLV
jgi:hypothetical protein